MTEPITTAGVLAGVFGHWGEAIIAALLAVIGWGLKVFGGRHIEQMDKLTERLSTMAGELREVKVKLSTIEDRLCDGEDRMSRIETHVDKVRDRIK